MLTCHWESKWLLGCYKKEKVRVSAFTCPKLKGIRMQTFLFTYFLVCGSRLKSIHTPHPMQMYLVIYCIISRPGPMLVPNYSPGSRQK